MGGGAVVAVAVAVVAVVAGVLTNYNQQGITIAVVNDSCSWFF